MSYKFILDTFAWIELFNGTEKGKKVFEIINNNSCASSVLIFFELSDKCSRDNLDFQLYKKYILTKAGIIPISINLADNVGKNKLFLRKINANISLADAIHYTTAIDNNAIFITGDPDFKDIKENILFL
ncbi:PIN domain-containing protein [Candidatus Woesearchaeota archaeon]|nr:PIN domain-containing protein [Candidatus Woesearchaeota archaeon]